MKRGDLVCRKQKDGTIQAMLFLRKADSRYYFLSKSKYTNDIAITLLSKKEIRDCCFVAAADDGNIILNSIVEFFDHMTNVCTECFKEDEYESENDI